MSGFLEIVWAGLLELFVGAVPERQPWRSLVIAFYVVGAMAGVGVLVWLATNAF